MAGLPKDENQKGRGKRNKLRLLTVTIFFGLMLGAGFYGDIITATTKPKTTEIEKAKYYHLPYLEQKCDTCHLADSDGKVRLKASIEELCFTCHKDKSEELVKYSVHQPFAQGDCLSCHNPHASENRYLLVNETNELCYKCHNDLRGRLESDSHSSIGGAAGTGLCLNCHRPHSSDLAALSTNDPVPFCQSCHNLSEPERNHPVGKPYLDERTGKELTCTSTCHDPHGSTFIYMLRQENNDGLCLTCHQVEELS